MDVVGVSATNGGDGGAEGRPEGVKVGGRDAVAAQADNRSALVLRSVEMPAVADNPDGTLVPTWWRELLAVTVITASAVTAVALIRWCVGKQQ